MKFNDELKLLFRKPFKILLLIFLSSIFIFVFLSLMISFFVTNQAIDQMKDNYAQISTVVINEVEPNSTIKLDYQNIDTEIIDIIKDSKYVNDYDIRDSMAGRIEGINSINASFEAPTTNSTLVFKGELIDFTGGDASIDNIAAKDAILRVNELIAGKDGWVSKGAMLSAMIISDKVNNIDLKEDKEYIFIASPYYNPLGQMNNSLSIFKLSDQNLMGQDISYLASYALKNGILDSEEEIDEDFLSILDREIKNQDNLYNIRLADDMQMIIPIANETMFLTDGRFIEKEDKGKDICIISKELADKHHLKLGDSLDIALSNEVYNNNGYISAFPKLFEEGAYNFGESKNYKIVGIYKYASYDFMNSSMLYSFNDIFIPKYKEDLNIDYISASNFSFKIGVDNIRDFEEKTLPNINKKGYSLVSAESNWASVESSFKSLRKSMLKNLSYSLIIGLLGIFIVNFINTRFFRKEYYLRRIFAGERSHIEKPLKIGFYISMILGISISILTIFLSKDRFLIGQGIENIDTSLNKAIIMWIFVIILMYIIISIIINKIFIKKNNNKSLVELIES
ncbi:hypothetical protein [uncultured Anaerococcus sp.]|uniref:hypothetical protein n=1 Tax=uncultured Anaerococcus sp. TaxID=293428 RepID=UPI002612A2B0|nr:hypothetical protein [uncultured Anaerococcus sp.]